MHKISYAMLSAVIMFTACKNDDYKKGEHGLEYKIIPTGSGPKIKDGQFMQLNVTQYYSTGKKDSLLSDTRTDRGPYMDVLNSVSTPAGYYEILAQMRKGDSAVVRVLTDSIFAKNPKKMPAFFSKGHYLFSTFKLFNVLTGKAASDSARVAEMKISEKRDSVKAIETNANQDRTLQEYFSKNNIKALKAPRGTYVEIIKPGTGNNIDTNNVAVVNYTGRVMGGDVFDSNTDASKGSVLEPFNVNMTSDGRLGGNVISGWKDGLGLLNKAAVAKFYIPSSLGYGPTGNGPIPANAILIFDIEVKDVLDREQGKAVLKAQADKLMARQKAFMDSVADARKARTDTSHKKPAR